MPEGMRNPPSSATNLPWNWVLQKGLQDSLPGFHLAQHCQCYYPSSRGNVPATVSSMQYCKDIGMWVTQTVLMHLQYNKWTALSFIFRLAIGTNRGFALVDTVNNRCLYILSNLNSILRMCNIQNMLYKTRKCCMLVWRRWYKICCRIFHICC